MKIKLNFASNFETNRNVCLSFSRTDRIAEHITQLLTYMTRFYADICYKYSKLMLCLILILFLCKY